MYSAFTLTWIIVNDFQVEFFSFNYRKQWKSSVGKNDINQVRVNGLYICLLVKTAFGEKFENSKLPFPKRGTY